MKIVKTLLLAIVVIVVLSAIAGMFMSSKFKMERSVVINADQKIIFDQLNTLKNWEVWSPWQKMDPETQLTYSGPPSGVGASYDWVSSKNGEGTLTITESTPYQLIITEMDFRENGKGLAGFNMSKAGNGNKLSWWFESDLGGNPFKKLFAGLMGRSFMGKVFDQGLNDIKKIAESAPVPAAEVAPMPLDTISVTTDSVPVK